MKKIWKTRRSLSSSPSTFSVLSSPLVYAFANVLMRCVVTMVSNVSDSSESWPCMSLHAHMLEHLQTPHGADGTQACTYTAYNHKHLERWTSACVRVCTCIFVHMHTKRMRAKVQSSVCQDETAAASCTRRETSCCFAPNRGRSAKISANQLCRGWMKEVSLTASRRKTQKHYEATR